MKKVQQAGDFSIFQKRSGRYAVQDKAKNWVNAEEKAKILLDSGLIKASAPKPKPAATEEPKEADETVAAGDAQGDESNPPAT